MPNSIRILIAAHEYIFREGLKAIISDEKSIKLVAEADHEAVIIEKIAYTRPDVLLIDPCMPLFELENLQAYHQIDSQLKFMFISNPCPKEFVAKAIELGVKSYILKECDREEVLNAIKSAKMGEGFFCGKILDVLVESKNPENTCNPVLVSGRELEIIRLIAEGFTNKEIADQLFLSTHTVTTHRKNIMLKLGVNNTAGIVLYAVRESLISPNKYLFASVN